MLKWIRLSGPGEFRGDGTWHEVRGDAMEKDFAKCKETGFLPVAWEVPESEIVKDSRGKEPNYVIRDGLVVHQFHRIAVPIIGVGDKAKQYAHRQLMHLLKSKLIIEGDPS
uniref:Uncharacterized protein n=1 Tax=Dinoroseobacter phage vB_DshS_R26L TaxID=3161158 RepID=A0AAU7VGM2_9CAUD